MGISLKGSRKRLHGSYFNASEVINDYLTWLEQIFYVLVYRFNYNEGKYEYGAFRSPKRGDDLYAKRVLSRFTCLRKSLEDKWFFDRRKRSGHVDSPCLHITLEYNANKTSLLDSWNYCGVDFNRYMSFLRRTFGKCSIIRCFEAHESAYCHIHLIVLFHNYLFKGKAMRSKKGRIIFRVIGEDFSKLKSGWIHGYSDIQAVDSVKGGVYYLSKYLSKSISVKEAGDKGVKGLAMCWFMRKRSFSVSGEFRSIYHDVINTNSNSNNEIISLMLGWDLFGEKQFLKVTRWKLLGFLPSDHVIWEVNFVMLESTQIVCVDEGRRLFELVKDDVIVDECQKHL